MQDTKARSAIVAKLLNPAQPKHEPEVQESEEAYKEARAKSREAYMLDVMFADGSIESFDYSLPKRISYNPSGTLILRFGKDRIEVEGRNLHRVRQAVTECRAKLIQEGTEAELDVKPEDAAHIDRIVITEADEGM
jgi:hypothetical protein